MSEKRIETANNAYYVKFGISPIFIELSDEQHLEEWFIKELEDAVKYNDSEIDITKHIDHDVIY